MNPAGDAWLALGMGLLGGFGHCAGMCGPIVAAVSLTAGPRLGWRKTLPLHLAYNAGRVTTYALAGAAMGLVGSVVNIAGRAAGLQQAVAVLAGAMMIAMGLGAAGLLPWARRLEQGVSSRLFSGAGGLLRAGGLPRTFLLGLFLGLLPCGLSWTAFVGSAATGGALPGALFALSFALGTAPALLLVGGAAALLSVKVRGTLFRVGGVAVALLGLLFLLRGLGLHAL